ncbi:MAG: hypothetical protein ACI9VI_000308 [Candidatus Azotimanducaceae bacterium]|jgi:uncharacterized protein (TIGR02099 family)
MISHAKKKLLVRFFEGTVLIVLVILAAYVSMGRILINTVDRYAQDLEELLSSSLNIPVSIQKLEGSWTYLNPKLEIKKLKIGFGNESVVDLESLILEVDTLASIGRMKPIISGIEISGLSLTSIQDGNGKWSIRGLPSGNTKVNFNPILDAILYLEKVSLENIQIDVLGENVAYRLNSIPDLPFELGLEDDLKTLSWPIALSNLNQTSKDFSQIHLFGQYKGDPRDRGFESKLFFNLPSLDIGDFLPRFIFKGTKISNVFVRGQFWLVSNDSGHHFTGVPIVESVFASNKLQGEVKLLENIEIEFLLRGLKGEGGLLQLSKLEGRIGGESWLLSDLAMAFSPSEQGMELGVHIPSLSISQFSQTIVEIESRLQTSNPDLTHALHQLNFQGEVEDLYIHALLSEKPRINLTANLLNISVDQYKQAFSISQLDGFIKSNQESGYIDVHNEHLYEVNYPALFPKPWLFDSTHGRVNYGYKDDVLTLTSGLVEVRKGDLQAIGRFHINLPEGDLNHTWGLELGVRNAPLLETFRYLPITLPPEVRLWLSDAVIGGVGKMNGMVFHGSLNRQADKREKAFDIFFHVEDTIFEYDPRWPRLDDLSAHIYVGNNEIHSDDANARIFDSRVVNSEVTVPISQFGVVDTVLIDGGLRGSVSDGLRLLTETPLFDITNKMAESWDGKGKMKGVARLNIPLGQRSEEAAYVDMVVDFTNTLISMPEYDIDIIDLSGKLAYESTSGISSPGFTGKLFDEDVIGSVSTIGDPDSGVIDVNVKGQVAVNSLYEWTGQPLLTRGFGKIQYQSQLHIPYGERGAQAISIDTFSDLQGVDINMPSPIGKTPNEKKNLEYTQVFLDSVSRIEIKIGDEFSAELQVMDEVLTGGRIHLGENLMGAVTFDNLKITGAIDDVDFEEWDGMIIDLQNLSDVSLEGELAETLDTIQVDVGMLDVYGFELEDVSTRITRNPTAWKVELDSEMLLGVVSVMDADDDPLEVELEYLKVESTASSEDPLVDVVPSEMVSANVKLKKLLVGHEDYGDWSFSFRPVGDGAKIDKLVANVKGFQLLGGGEVNWRYGSGEHISGFSGKVSIPDLATSLEQWGFASSIEGNDFTFDANVTWPGTPAMADLDIITGRIILEQGSGRFVQAESNVGALKLLGIFDFASLARRFRLDFSDVVSSGFTFSKIAGETRFNHGIVDVYDPIVIEGSSNIFTVAGRMNLETEAIDSDMVVTLPVSRNLPWYAAYSAFVVNPLTGAGVFLAQKLFKQQIDTISSAKYRITGTVDEPLIEFVSIFNSTVRNAPEEADGSLLEKADGSLLEKADGSLLEEADGSLLEKADGSLLEKADGSLLEKADGSLLEKADGSLLEKADGSLLEEADGSLLEEADGSLLEEADGSLLEEADGSLLEEADGSLLEKADGS